MSPPISTLIGRLEGLTIQGRWQGVLDAWAAYLGCRGGTDTLTHTLISLDSFIDHAADFNDIAERARNAIIALEQLSENRDEASEYAISALINNIQTLVYAMPAASDRPVITKKGKVGEQSSWVVLYWPDPDEASNIASQIEHYGYNVLIHTTVSKAVNSAITKNAIMLVVDVSNEASIILQNSIPSLNISGIQWLAVSDKGSFQERLALVRLQATDVIHKPTTASLLVDAIDRNAHARTIDPYRVMVIDASADVQIHVQKILSTIHVQHMGVTDVSLVLEAMEIFSPDLILMDMRLESCSGLEVAQIIRQHEQFVSIPIVYMSDEPNLQIQIDAIRMGGDAFLAKPLHHEYLLATVSSKVSRYNSLRKFMIQDSLTGLLNHTRIKQHLSQALSLAKRNCQPVSFAMLDIDHFKKVNDTYGHPVGDRVIKSLAKMLQQRVRSSDVVGRYGGEEFAVVLHGIDPEGAAIVMDRIRKDFSTVYHPYDNGIFGVTFSCGIAGYPGEDDPTRLASKADSALYTAKHAGRNRVAVYDPKNDQQKQD
jgi:two-component system cell cycle response regulator